MADYIIGTAFWDGTVLHRKGSKLAFPEGEAPPNSKLVPEPEPEPVAKPAAVAKK